MVSRIANGKPPLTLLLPPWSPDERGGGKQQGCYFFSHRRWLIGLFSECMGIREGDRLIRGRGAPCMLVSL